MPTPGSKILGYALHPLCSCIHDTEVHDVGPCSDDLGMQPETSNCPCGSMINCRPLAGSQPDSFRVDMQTDYKGTPSLVQIVAHGHIIQVQALKTLKLDVRIG